MNPAKRKKLFRNGLLTTQETVTEVKSALKVEEKEVKKEVVEQKVVEEVKPVVKQVEPVSEVVVTEEQVPTPTTVKKKKSS